MLTAEADRSSLKKEIVSKIDSFNTDQLMAIFDFIASSVFCVKKKFFDNNKSPY